MEACTIQNEVLRAEFRALGAELRRWTLLGGPELLWTGDPEVWGAHVARPLSHRGAFGR